jgi:hypothetical protein
MGRRKKKTKKGGLMTKNIYGFSEGKRMDIASELDISADDAWGEGKKELANEISKEAQNLRENKRIKTKWIEDWVVGSWRGKKLKKVI